MEKLKYGRIEHVYAVNGGMHEPGNCLNLWRLCFDNKSPSWINKSCRSLWLE